MRCEEITPRVLHEILLNMSGGVGYDVVVEAALRARFDVADDAIEFKSHDVGTEETFGVVTLPMKYAGLAEEILSFLAAVTDEEYGKRWTTLTVTVKHFVTLDP